MEQEYTRNHCSIKSTCLTNVTAALSSYGLIRQREEGKIKQSLGRSHRMNSTAQVVKIGVCLIQQLSS